MERPQIDLLDETLWQANPHETWAWMRAHEPVFHDPKNGLWAITKLADVLAVERDAAAFPSDHAYRAIRSDDESNMIAQDDPGHREQRMLVQRFFAPGVVARRHDKIRDTVRALLDDICADAAPGDEVTFDVVDAIAAKLPAILTARLMGFEESDWPLIRNWSERLMRTDSRERSDEAMHDFYDANVSLFHATTERVAYKREHPGDDLFTVWANATVGGAPMGIHTIMHEAGLFVSGGAETTRTTIAHGIRAFVDHPDQRETLAHNPGAVAPAVEEVLRWVTPLNNFFRVSRGDNTVSGTVIPDGDRAMLVYPSANRDESVFDNPFRFDITRTPNHHVAFGNGPHTCIGAPLARLSLRAVFELCAQRLTDLQVITEPDVEANLFARAVKTFKLRATIRTSTKVVA